MESKDEITMFGGQDGDKKMIDKKPKVLIVGNPIIGMSSAIDEIKNIDEDILIINKNEFKNDSTMRGALKQQFAIYEKELDRITHQVYELPSYNGINYKRKLSSNINLSKEYELIKQKKSKLSKWEREEVVRLIEERGK